MNGKLKPFSRGRLDVKPRAFIDQTRRSHNCSRAEAKRLYQKLMADEIWINDEYQVNLDKNPAHGFGDTTIWHLSIKRRDKQPIHDWRDLQAIKNMLAGPEVEAFELYPAESRVVDTANQFHLWCLVDPGNAIPVGWTERYVSSSSEDGAVQRELAD